MNKTILILIIIISIFTITGCGIKYPELDDNAIPFYTSEYVDDDNTSYLTIEYNGRKYIPYGTLKNNLREKDIDKCIGFIVQADEMSSKPDMENKDTRVYTLIEDKGNNFLMEYYIGTDLMNQPSFYRAIDTKGKDILIPYYIDPSDHNFWK